MIEMVGMQLVTEVSLNGEEEYPRMAANKKKTGIV